MCLQVISKKIEKNRIIFLIIIWRRFLIYFDIILLFYWKRILKVPLLFEKLLLSVYMRAVTGGYPG